MKSNAIEKHYQTLLKEVNIIIKKEKINNSTDTFQLLKENLRNLRNNGRIYTDEDFTRQFNIVLADTYKVLTLRVKSFLHMIKTLNTGYFHEQVNIDQIAKEAERWAKTSLDKIYQNAIKELDFILINYKMGEYLNDQMRQISVRKIREVTQ